MAQNRPNYAFKTHRYHEYILKQSLYHNLCMSSKINRRWSYQTACNKFWDAAPWTCPLFGGGLLYVLLGQSLLRFSTCKAGTIPDIVMAHNFSSHPPHSLPFGKAAVPVLQLPFQIIRESLERGEDILAQGQSKQDLSFACHSPKCVNTWSDQQRGVLPDYGHREIKAATLLNRISHLYGI